MNYNLNKKEQQRRRDRKKLTNKQCNCGKEAVIPWKGYHFCLDCWNELKPHLKEIGINDV